MPDRTMSSWGEAYRAVPIVEQWGDAGWKAGVLLSAGDARGERPAKSLGEQLFASREDAWQFANSEYSSLGG
ncbi:MAG: hypothetical protein JO090_00650 [Rhizobacter sp.]|nr:hypothetical protein [Rhizobacter sp.]